MAFLGLVFVPMKLKRFRQTRKFYPCNLSVYQIQYDTFSYHIVFKAIRKYSLYHLAYHIIQSYIISNTITSSIKYYVKLFPLLKKSYSLSYYYLNSNKFPFPTMLHLDDSENNLNILSFLQKHFPPIISYLLPFYLPTILIVPHKPICAHFP